MPSTDAPRYDVFLSYRTDHNVLARLVKSELLKQGLSVFLDKDDLGYSKFPEKLTACIQNCSNFVILLTHGFLDRCRNDPEDYCRHEIEDALAAGRRIILVAEDDKVDMNAKLFPDSIRAVAKLNAVIYNHQNYGSFVAKLLDQLDCTSTRRSAESDWKAMEDTVKTPAYRAWQESLLYAHYSAQAPAATAGADGRDGPDGEIDAVGPSFFPTVAGLRYPIVCYVAADSATPFEQAQICKTPLEFREPEELPNLNDGPDVQVPAWVTAGDAGVIRRRYFEMLSYTRRVRRWNMRGFALSGLELNEKQEVTGYHARLCTYGENCLTSHLLGYQLYARYRSEQEAGSAAVGGSGDRPDVQLRGDSGKPSPQVLQLPATAPFFPLISVQGLVVFRNSAGKDDWKILAMERGGKVSSAAGFWQFPPAGGFEIYGTEDESRLHIKKQFDIRLALIREFLEEIFGDLDMTCADQEGARSSHEGSAGFVQVMKSLQSEAMSIHFLGVVTDLVSLRSEFSFLIVIEDPQVFGMSYLVNDPESGQRIAKWMCGSDESKRIHSLDFEDVADVLEPSSVWNPSSIGLLKLFADLTQDAGGWLRKRYADMPVLMLP